MKPFDVLGPLPTGTTVLEASAGTGKTFTVGALVTRYVAEGVATLPEMLVITFGRAASQELRERVRTQLVEAERALADPLAARGQGGLIAHLAAGDDAEVAQRRRRIADALAGFDGATIATTHQFCQLVLTSLGVAGDTDARVQLVENLDDLVDEVTDDLYLERFGDDIDEPPFAAAAARALAGSVVNDPQAELAPADAQPSTTVAERVAFGEAVRAELDRRKQRQGILSFDDLLSRLNTALDADDAPARDRMRHRWKIVLVDEFQDTDPVQWSVLVRAFAGHATLVLIGDPKQAIYAFRGGDVVTYLDAVGTATDLRTLPANYRSDGPLVDALQVLTLGAELGDPRITVHPVVAHRGESRLAGLPSPHPVRLRVVRPDQGVPSLGIDILRSRIADDLADDVARLLGSDATFDDGHDVRSLRAGDVAILLQGPRREAAVFREALWERSIPSIDTSGGSVLLERAGDEWLSLLEALEQQRTPRVRAVALGPFVGHAPASLDAGGDDLTDEIAELVRGWLDLFRARGIAAVHESITAGGLAERVLSRPEGERLLTDLNHVAEALHDVAHRERLGLPALLEWLRRERRRASAADERTRRLDTDAAAVQIVSIHRSKGLQWPVVYLPTLFNRWFDDRAVLHRYHQGSTRTLDVGGAATPQVKGLARQEDAAEELRLAYVAMTRAQSQVVTWWGPSKDAVNSGLSRLLLRRQPGEAAVPDRVGLPSDHELGTTLRMWEAAGAIHLEQVVDDAAPPVAVVPGDVELDVRTFDRAIDTAWRRTSYSGLIRAEEQSREHVPQTETEPEVAGTVDEDEPDDDDVNTPPASDTSPSGPLSPMNDLPAGATFGSLVHGVLEHADPQADDLVGELREHVAEQLRWWPVDAGVDELAEALVPLQLTSLGPLAGGLRLADIAVSDRLCELDFEFPLVGGDRPDLDLADTPLRGVADVLRRHLPADDPMRAYAERLESPSLGDQVLRGYLSGSIDVVLRVPDPGAGHRYVVVDYKTNKFGDPDRPLTALDYTPELMTEAMLHSHYPLQALLYSVVLHRFLRWRLADYDPERHLGGILYLYVRGMCGPETPEVDGQPCGVFAWNPPVTMVVELSRLLGGAVAAEGVAS
ncbi:MAG: UvrD-helicase domain-containing protein [Aeromicrobium sp.]